MPKLYEQIKRQYLMKGLAEDEAQRIAAATYNKYRKPGQKPVTGSHQDKKT